MKLDNPDLRRQFSGAGRCEFCGTYSSNRHCHHIMSRGAGHVDIPSNLIALDFVCHSSCHGGGHPTPDHLQRIAARREGITPEEAIAEVHRIRALDREGKEIKRGR